MAKINLLIADPNEGYTENLVNYLVENHSDKFTINCFTQFDKFSIYFIENFNNIDVLLINPQFYIDEINEKLVNTIIFLVDGNIIKTKFELKENQLLMNKYQHGQKLVNTILNKYSETNNSDLLVTGNKKKTRVIGVYSSSGGVGKTTTAINLCVQFSQKGLSTFYLNLENFQSTFTFFENDSKDKNLSNIFFHLKEKSKVLNLKIKNNICLDSKSKISYFNQLDSMLEINEILASEIKVLIETLKLIKEFDVIVIDLSSDFNERNIEVLDNCDDIYLIILEDKISIHKTNLLLKELDILNKKKNLYLTNKITIILNKCNSNYCSKNFNFEGAKLEGSKSEGAKFEEIKLEGIHIDIILPKIPDMANSFINSSFGASLNPLINKTDIKANNNNNNNNKV